MAELASSESDINSRPGVFRFLDLAAEIRNEVYSLLVVAEAQVYNLAIFSTPAIAGVSSQLRSESLPMIFAEAEFFMNVFADLHVSEGVGILFLPALALARRSHRTGTGQ